MTSLSLLQCIEFASLAHATQRRKDPMQSPYINHPIAVATFLASHVDPASEGYQDAILAALLHDTIEDTLTTFESLVKEFGEKVAWIVMECTDDKSKSKVERKKLQIEHAKHISKQAKWVKLADKYDNVKGLIGNPPATWSKEIVFGYAVWASEVCAHLKGVSSKMDAELDALFSHFGIDKMSKAEREKELALYYERCTILR